MMLRGLLVRSILRTQQNRFSYSMLTDKLSARQDKKAREEFKTEIEHMANKPSFTFMDYKLRINEELSKLTKGTPWLTCRTQSQIFLWGRRTPERTQRRKESHGRDVRRRASRRSPAQKRPEKINLARHSSSGRKSQRSHAKSQALSKHAPSAEENEGKRPRSSGGHGVTPVRLPQIRTWIERQKK